MDIINGKEISEQNFTEGTSLFMQCHAMCKIEFHDQEFRKMKKSNGIELLKFSIENRARPMYRHADVYWPI